MLKYFITFVLGAGVGFLLSQKKADEKYAKLAQEEIDSVKEVFSRTARMAEKPLHDKVPDPSEDCVLGVDLAKNVGTPPHNLTRSNPYEKAKRNYNVIPMPEPITEVDRTRPYLISDEEFTEEFDHHDKLSLYYYKKDGVLSEEADDIVDNVEELVGVENLLVLDEKKTIWVRNEPCCKDFEIVGINNSYAEVAHGLVEESPRERHKRANIKKANKNEQ